MKKKRYIAISILGLLVLWMTVSMLLPPALKAKSKDNKWHAVYTVDHSLKKHGLENLNGRKKTRKYWLYTFWRTGK